MKAHWLTHALLTMALWGVWGAFAGLPSDNGFPETLNYIVWALTMIVPSLIVLRGKVRTIARDRMSIALGMAIGLLGAGGQLFLFYALRQGPAYLIFPIISLSPVVTIALSFTFLRERTGRIGVIGIALALLALPLFDFRSDGESVGYGVWFIYALIILVAWGLQAYFIKLANQSMSVESIFAYMTVCGLALIPIALAMTDFSQPINWHANGPWLAAAIQMLNAVGALTLVYAYRYGQAIVVSPLTNAGAPLLTAVIALLIANVVPSQTKLAAIVLAIASALLLALQPESPPLPQQKPA
jgi:drug/metabolite transporter (DMT)-like permease